MGQGCKALHHMLLALPFCSVASRQPKTQRTCRIVVFVYCRGIGNGAVDTTAAATKENTVCSISQSVEEPFELRLGHLRMESLGQRRENWQLRISVSSHHRNICGIS